jgi:hypothetical protein
MYYVRSSSIADYSSIKRLKFLGLNRDMQCVFEFSAGNNVQQNLHPIFSIFSPDSDAAVYDDTIDYAVDPNVIDGGDASDDVIYEIDRGASNTEFSNELDGGNATEETTALFECKNYTAQFYNPEIVKYEAINNFPSTADRAFSCWFRLKQNIVFTSAMTISVPIDQYSREMTITFSKSFDSLVGQHVSIQKTGSSIEIYGKITRIIDRNNVVIEIDKDILNHLNMTFPSWKTMTGYTVNLSSPKVFLNGLDQNKGIQIELWGRKYFILTSNGTKYLFALGAQQTLAYDQWYSICVNMSNLFSELTLNVWETQSGTTELKIFFTKTDKNFPRIDRSTNAQFMLESSDMDITNLRLWSQKIETDKQSLILNQNIVKDANNAIIIDNAIPQSRLPYISYTH